MQLKLKKSLYGDFLSFEKIFLVEKIEFLFNYCPIKKKDIIKGFPYLLKSNFESKLLDFFTHTHSLTYSQSLTHLLTLTHS